MAKVKFVFEPTLAGNVAWGLDLNSLTETAKPAMSIANSRPACDWSVVKIKPSDWSKVTDAHLESVIEAGDPVVPHNGRAHPELEDEAHGEHGDNLRPPDLLEYSHVVTVVIIREIYHPITLPVSPDPVQRCSSVIRKLKVRKNI